MAEQNQLVTNWTPGIQQILIVYEMYQSSFFHIRNNGFSPTYNTYLAVLIRILHGSVEFTQRFSESLQNVT
jgi:hypothetical protein